MTNPQLAGGEKPRISSKIRKFTLYSIFFGGSIASRRKPIGIRPVLVWSLPTQHPLTTSPNHTPGTLRVFFFLKSTMFTQATPQPPLPFQQASRCQQLEQDFPLERVIFQAQGSGPCAHFHHTVPSLSISQPVHPCILLAKLPHYLELNRFSATIN